MQLMSLVYFKYDVVLIYEVTHAREQYPTKITNTTVRFETPLDFPIQLNVICMDIFTQCCCVYT
jgi:hypothetical protein